MSQNNPFGLAALNQLMSQFDYLEQEFARGQLNAYAPPPTNPPIEKDHIKPSAVPATEKPNLTLLLLEDD